jgi:hypothetical protein
MCWMRCDRLAKDQPAEFRLFQISEVQEVPAFNGRRSFLTLRHDNNLLGGVRTRGPAGRSVLVALAAAAAVRRKWGSTGVFNAENRVIAQGTRSLNDDHETLY